jgi:hypothetical protein
MKKKEWKLALQLKICRKREQRRNSRISKNNGNSPIGHIQMGIVAIM